MCARKQNEYIVGVDNVVGTGHALECTGGTNFILSGGLRNYEFLHKIMSYELNFSKSFAS